MRPRKTVLIYSRDSGVAGEIRQFVEIRLPHHRAYVVGECGHEIADQAHCFVVDRDPHAVALLAQHGKAMLTINLRLPSSLPSQAGFVVAPGDWVRLQEAILHATARKRGPQKKPAVHRPAHQLCEGLEEHVAS